MKTLYALSLAAVLAAITGCAQFTDPQIAAARAADYKYRCELITSNHQYACLGLLPWKS